MSDQNNDQAKNQTPNQATDQPTDQPTNQPFGQPDMNQGAMRPESPAQDGTRDGEDGVPNIDRPPRSGADVPLFDEATTAEERQREYETLQPDTPAQSESTEQKRQSGAI